MAGENVRLLLIETSGRTGRVGLAVGPDVVSERPLDATRRHARDLAPAIADLLQNQGWRPRDLAGVLVSLGPGSYTGLRVGVMSAKALAYATGCAVVSVPTFHAIARQASVPGRELEVIADALQGKLYVQAFGRTGDAGAFHPAGGLHIVSGREWANRRRPGCAVTGPGLRAAQSYLPPTTPAAPSVDWEPTLAGLLDVGWSRFVLGERDAVIGLEPIYLRPSSAEEQWDRFGKSGPGQR
jgi:tRNA threonylcarbamoyladenosine biosynthesis protein TsaB